MNPNDYIFVTSRNNRTSRLTISSIDLIKYLCIVYFSDFFLFLSPLISFYQIPISVVSVAFTFRIAIDT